MEFIYNGLMIGDVATMKEAKIDYVKKEFQQTFYSPVLRNSHYIDLSRELRRINLRKRINSRKNR